MAENQTLEEDKKGLGLSGLAAAGAAGLAVGTGATYGVGHFNLNQKLAEEGEHVGSTFSKVQEKVASNLAETWTKEKFPNSKDEKFLESHAQLQKQSILAEGRTGQIDDLIKRGANDAKLREAEAATTKVANKFKQVSEASKDFTEAKLSQPLKKFGAIFKGKPITTVGAIGLGALAAIGTAKMLTPSGSKVDQLNAERAATQGASPSMA